MLRINLADCVGLVHHVRLLISILRVLHLQLTLVISNSSIDVLQAADFVLVDAKHFAT